jgi:hypothetical protein
VALMEARTAGAERAAPLATSPVLPLCGLRGDHCRAAALSEGPGDPPARADTLGDRGRAAWATPPIHFPAQDACTANVGQPLVGLAPPLQVSHAGRSWLGLPSPRPAPAQVPRAGERLATVAARHEAAAALREAGATLAAHRAAAAELGRSGTLAAALATALAAGNVLNHGTRLGRAAGFRLRSLARLQARRWTGSGVGVPAALSAYTGMGLGCAAGLRLRSLARLQARHWTRSGVGATAAPSAYTGMGLGVLAGALRARPGAAAGAPRVHAWFIPPRAACRSCKRRGLAEPEPGHGAGCELHTTARHGTPHTHSLPLRRQVELYRPASQGVGN